ncbi:serine/threonine-protein kinase RIO1 [Agrilus planipennis]|uniref:Serine/threonine-protein kinase RIO1 n=1 Tax=Agrilus planipennis TaxID=224129 RepID=A0A1W4XSS8_AGRPL|nr:serine/threonine-protein kinase RIO1 [Agrilus planipennis]
MTTTNKLTEDELFCDVEDEFDFSPLNINPSSNIGEAESSTSDYDEDDDGFDNFYEDRNKARKNTGDSNVNVQQSSNKMNSYQPNEQLFRKYLNKINVEKYEGPSNLPQSAKNVLIENQKRLENERIRTKDKKDRATAEQVMDLRTRMILFKLLNRNLISEINGCISTGKEANVYHATSDKGEDFAIKVYKTSILIFKDRDKYVSGEFRFRHGYCRHNPRKMVRTWAEKEMRNLIRLYNNGVNVPKPILLRSHVLIMGFIGIDGWPAPLLKDANLEQSESREVYREIVIMMWKMYNKCHLVHGDLSEFNILYLNGQVYIIDVSQSVEHDHPHALELLRKDCTNITAFFRKQEVAVMTIKQLFDFITDPSINERNMEECLEKLAEIAAKRTLEEISAQEQVEEEVFKNAYIPKRLIEVVDYERDINKAKAGESVELVYKTLIGLKADLSGTVEKPQILDEMKNEEEIEESNEESNGSESSDSEDSRSKFINSARPKNETLEEKKARKKNMKEEKAKKRETKIKKHVKKRKEKISKKK